MPTEVFKRCCNIFIVTEIAFAFDNSLWVYTWCTVLRMTPFYSFVITDNSSYWGSTVWLRFQACSARIWLPIATWVKLSWRHADCCDAWMSAIFFQPMKWNFHPYWFKSLLAVHRTERCRLIFWHIAVIANWQVLPLMPAFPMAFVKS